MGYGTNSDADVDLDDQRLPFAVEVTVARDTDYLFVLGSDYSGAGPPPTLRCRAYVNDVLVGESVSPRSCIVGIDVASIFGS